MQWKIELLPICVNAICVVTYVIQNDFWKASYWFGALIIAMALYNLKG